MSMSVHLDLSRGEKVALCATINFGHIFAELPAQGIRQKMNGEHHMCCRCDIRTALVLMPCVCQRQQYERGVPQHVR
jgi:hypothetical protein